MSHPPDDTKCCELIAWEFFEAYTKKVCRNYARNLRRSLFRRAKRESFQGRDDLQIVSADKHVPDFFEVEGKTYEIHNDLVFQGLMRLPEKHLNALVLHFWECWSDAEIASHYGVVERTIRKWRKQSLDIIREHIQKGEDD